MKILLNNNTIYYVQFLKLFTVAWVFGIGSFYVVLGLIGTVLWLFSGDVAGALQMALLAVGGPLLLLIQGPIFGSFAYIGIIIYRKYFGLEFNENI